MNYPCLIPKHLCKTDISVELAQEGVNKYGETLEPIKWSGKCNYQDKGRTIFTTEKKVIQLTGCALIPGDIAPMQPNITGGTITVNGVVRHIEIGTKNRNPDGTVNYTRLDVR